MSGKILEMARKDAAKFVKSGGFEEDISISSPSGITLEIKGLHSKHWIGFDSTGVQINSKNAHILINENDLKEGGIETRNAISGNVDLRRFKVVVKDSTLIGKKYVITETYPSETFGLIVCILGDYE